MNLAVNLYVAVALLVFVLVFQLAQAGHLEGGELGLGGLLVGSFFVGVCWLPFLVASVGCALIDIGLGRGPRR